MFGGIDWESDVYSEELEIQTSCIKITGEAIRKLKERLGGLRGN